MVGTNLKNICRETRRLKMKFNINRSRGGYCYTPNDSNRMNK
jgi:arylamine N-acetyltransferase